MRVKYQKTRASKSNHVPEDSAGAMTPPLIGRSLRVAQSAFLSFYQ